jgi:hypothetical protein
MVLACWLNAAAMYPAFKLPSYIDMFKMETTVVEDITTEPNRELEGVPDLSHLFFLGRFGFACVTTIFGNHRVLLCFSEHRRSHTVVVICPPDHTSDSVIRTARLRLGFLDLWSILIDHITRTPCK